MWIFTHYGFFSVVCTKDDLMQIRARNKNHLQRLCDVFPKELKNAEIISVENADYAWRIIVDSAEWEAVAYQLANEIDYTNFKDDCKKCMPNDKMYLGILSRIWTLMAGYQDDLQFKRNR